LLIVFGNYLDEVADCVRLKTNAEDHPEGGKSNFDIVSDCADVSETYCRYGLECPIKSSDVVAETSGVYLVLLPNPGGWIEIL
jgi:hypothetical protein